MAHGIRGLLVTIGDAIPPHPPFCVLMVGLPGSGKTTLARALVGRGYIRISPDEEMFRRHGVYGVDFPRGIFPTLEKPVLADMRATLVELLEAGNSVVVDHGFWTPEDRTLWRETAESAGASTVLVYLEASHEKLWERISDRNKFHEYDPNAIFFSESDLKRYRARFVPPQADEPYVLYDGRPEIVRAWEEARV